MAFIATFIYEAKGYDRKQDHLILAITPTGSYSYVDAKKQLGIELSVDHYSDYSELFQALLNGTANPLDELK